ncbi:hypothetical protein ABFX02_03G041900 [Erythranthe guttata]
MGIQAMKIHHLARALFWDHEPPSLTLGCKKRLRPLAPKLTTTAAATAATFDLKSFIRPESGPPKIGSPPDSQKNELPKVEGAQPGGTRWNPTQEQIGILEMLYGNGMRTPNANQIEQITAQLAKYGKIEGKNVFYWFQNHKARERQKQKRISLGLSRSRPRTPPSPFPAFSTPLLSSSSSSTKSEGRHGELFEDNPYKRKNMSWAFDLCLQQENICCTEEEEDEEETKDTTTLELFPLRPEGRS